MAIDIKDVQASIEDGLKKNKDSILELISKGDKDTAEKVNANIEELKKLSVKQAEDDKKELKSTIDELALKVKAGQATNEKKSFTTAIATALKDNHETLLTDMKEGKSGRSIDVKDFNWSDFSNYAPFVTDYRAPITNPYSNFHYRNIIPSGSTNGAQISYPKEGATTGAANSWMHTGDDTAAKPEIEPSFAPYTSKVEWIAGLIKGVPVDMLEDLAWLTSFLQSKALNELMKAEDLQIQEGNGVSPNLSGFFTGTNSATYNGSYTVFIEKVIDAAYRQVADNFYNANNVVMSNADKVGVLLNKETGAGYTLPNGSVSVVNGQLNIAGLNVSSTAYLDPGQALIGDFNQSQFVIRSAPRLRFFEQNSDDAEKNQILIRVEERAALAIFSSLAFVKLTPGT